MPSSRPKYQQIADELRERISEGQLKPGDKLPTEKELSEQRNANRATVRQGLALLANEGLIKSSRPAGWFVRGDVRWRYRPQAEWRPHPLSPELDRWMSDAQDAGLTPSQSISVEIINPPPDVATRLDVPADSLVVARRRTRYLDGEPSNINDSHHPLDLVQGSEIMVPNDITRGTNQVLAELGHDQVRAIDEVEIRMPLPDEVARLELEPGTPVAVHRVTGYDANGKPVRCTINILPGTSHVIVWERTKDETVQHLVKPESEK